jgi:hypothetical protein
MRGYWILITAMCVAGCASQRQAAMVRETSVPPAQPLVREVTATRVVETRYDVRSYRDAENPSVRHEPHAVYRTTRVPARVEKLETTPREQFAPLSYAPLPADAELTAQIAAQKEINAQLRAIQTRMTSIEEQARTQLGTLVGQTEETLSLRRQLEEERARVRELETKLRDRAAAPSATVVSAGTPAADTKW